MEQDNITIDQMNEVIARFMGYKTYNNRYPRNHGIGAPEAEPEKCMIIQKAKYHTSWDWLMPVCHAIREKAFELRNHERAMLLLTKLNITLMYGGIGDVHLKAYDFIQWYNQNKNQ